MTRRSAKQKQKGKRRKLVRKKLKNEGASDSEQKSFIRVVFRSIYLGDPLIIIMCHQSKPYSEECSFSSDVQNILDSHSKMSLSDFAKNYSGKISSYPVVEGIAALQEGIKSLIRKANERFLKANYINNPKSKSRNPSKKKNIVPSKAKNIDSSKTKNRDLLNAKSNDDPKKNKIPPKEKNIYPLKANNRNLPKSKNNEAPKRNKNPPSKGNKNPPSKVNIRDPRATNKDAPKNRNPPQKTKRKENAEVAARPKLVNLNDLKDEGNKNIGKFQDTVETENFVLERRKRPKQIKFKGTKSKNFIESKVREESSSKRGNEKTYKEVFDRLVSIYNNLEKQLSDCEESIITNRSFNKSEILQEEMEEEDWESELLDYVKCYGCNETKQPLILNCFKCKSFNIHVAKDYDANCKSNEVLNVNCSSCGIIFSQSSNFLIEYSNDVYKFNRYCLEFAQSVIQSGFTYTKVFEAIKSSNIPTPSHDQFEVIFDVLYKWYQIKCEKMKILAADEVKKYYIRKGFQLDDNLLKVKVFFDGVRLIRERGVFYGIWFVIDAETEFLLDFETSSKSCEKCKQFWNQSKSKLTKEETETWTTQHKKKCSLSEEAIKAWDKEVSVNLFSKSVERGIMYIIFITKETPSRFEGLLESNPYGEANSLILYNYLKYSVYNFMKNLLTTSDVDSADRRKEWRQDVSLLTRFYMLSVILAKKDIPSIRRYTLGSVFHHISTDKIPLHYFCPEAPETWCNYKIDLANNITPRKGYHSDKSKIQRSINIQNAEKMLPILWKKLTDEEQLKMELTLEPNTISNLHELICGEFDISQFKSEIVFKYLTCDNCLDHNLDLGLRV